MAKKAADPYNLDYAEDTAGTFSSQRPGGYGGPSTLRPSAFPVPEPQAAGVATRPPISPKPLSGLTGQRVTADTAAGTTSAMTGAQMHSQDEFDRSMGFTPTTRTPGQQKLITDYLNPKPAAPTPAAAPAVPTIPGVKTQPTPVVPTVAPQQSGGPLDVLSGVPGSDFNTTLASQPPRSPLDVLRGTGPTPTPKSVPGQASGSEIAGGATRFALGAAGSKVAQNYLGTGKGELAAWDSLKASGRAIARPIAQGFGALRGFTRGLFGQSPAGVSNSSAAQFESPTKANPVPVTPTAPATNIDRSENAIGKFGVSDQEFKRRQLAFAGF
jgi:hypothetical protein